MRSIRSLTAPKHVTKLPSPHRRPIRPPKPKDKGQLLLYLNNKYNYDRILSIKSTSRSTRRTQRLITVIVDSGATVSVTGLRRLFRVLIKLSNSITIVLGKGTAVATHIGIVTWNFRRHSSPSAISYYSFSEIVLYCEDFRDLTILSVSRLERHRITYVQNWHSKYLINTAGMTSNCVPNELTPADLRAHRIITCRRDGGLTVCYHRPSEDLPAGAECVDFMTGRPYKFDNTLVLRLHKLAYNSPKVHCALQEGAHLAVHTAFLRSVPSERLIPYGDFYHGRGVMNEVDKELGLVSVGGYDNAPEALQIYRARNPTALSLEDCTDPRVPTVLERCEIAIYTPPCQPYSIGGRMLGSADPDGVHLVECLLPQRRMPPHQRPLATLLETVLGSLRFPEFQLVRQQLLDCDNQVTQHIFNSLDFGSSSKRERVFLLGIDSESTRRFPNAYARLLHELGEMPDLAPRAVIEYIDHPLARDDHQLRSPADYSKLGRPYDRNHRAPVKIAHYRTLKLEDDLFSAYAPATVIRASFPSWYLVNIRDWKIQHGHPIVDGDDRCVAIQLTPREAARAMDIGDDSPIGEEHGDRVAHRLVGNGIPVRLMRHIMTPIVWFLRIVHSGIDADAATTRRKVRFQLSSPAASRRFGTMQVTMTQHVDVSELLMDDQIDHDIAAASSATTTADDQATRAQPQPPTAAAAAIPPDSEETSYMPYRLDYRYIRRNRDARGWPPMMSPNDPSFARKVYEVSYNHRCDHNSRRKTEQQIEMGVQFKYTMYPGDTRYGSECSWCIQAKAARNRMRSRSITLGANRVVPLPGTHATMDTIDLGGARAGNFVTFFGSHRYSVNFCDLASDRTVSYPVQNLIHTSLLEAIKWYHHLCSSTTRRRLEVIYTDLAPAHYEQGKMAEHRAAEKYEFQAVAAGEHEKRSRIERKNYELMRRTRTNLMALIGHTIKGRLINKNNVKEFWNLALHRSVFDLWHTPSDYLLQETQTYRTPDMAWFENNTPPDRRSIRPFGESCFHYPKLPRERHNLDNPWTNCIYLFPAAFSPFNYKMVHIRPGVTIIDENARLQVTHQLKFHDATTWQVRASDVIASDASASQLPISTNHRWDSVTQHWVPESGASADAPPPPPPLEPPAEPHPGPPTIMDTEPEPVEHDPDNIEWDNLMNHSPPYEISLGPKGQRGKKGASQVRFELYRNAANVMEYQRLHPKMAFDLVDGRPVWRQRRSGEPFVSWRAEFRNDLAKGLFRFVRPDLQAKINARYPDARAEFGAAVDAELRSTTSGGGDMQPSPATASPTTPDTTPETDDPRTPAPQLPTPQPQSPTAEPEPARPPTTRRPKPAPRHPSVPGLPRRSARLRALQPPDSESNNIIMQRYTLLLALGHATALVTGYRGPLQTRTTTHALHNLWATDDWIRELEACNYRINPGAPEFKPEHINAILRNRAALRDPNIYSHDTGDQFSVPTSTPEERRRAIFDASCWQDHDWVEEAADFIAFNLHLSAICLNIQAVHRDQISLKTEQIAELKKITDSEERRLAAIAILKEIQQLCDLGTFELVERRPGDAKPIGSRLVLKVKYKADGAYDKHKARLVALGYQQRPGFDFFGTFSPMASLTTVRMIMSYAVEHGLPVYHSDIPNAFCQSDIDVKNLLFRLPTGIDVDGLDEKHTLRLIKSLYGLKQSPQIFRKLLHAFLEKELGFKSSSTDTCLYTWRAHGKRVYICSEVDDLVITGDDFDKITEIKQKLHARFARDDQKFDWEPIKSFLGIDINYNYDYDLMQPDDHPSCTFNVAYKIHTLFSDMPFLQKLGRDSNVPSHSSDEKTSGDKANLFFKEYGHKCNVAISYSDLARERSLKGVGYGIFNMMAKGAAKISNSLDHRMNLYLREHYRSIVGSLIYIMITCRPDLCFAVGKLSRHMHDPQEQHVEWLKRTLRYVRSTIDDRLRYTKMCESPAATMFDEINDGRAEFSCLVGFTDANHANAREAERKSISGFCYFLFGNLVMWKSKVQPITAASTHEAELIALSFCADEGLWMRNLLNEVGITQSTPTPILCDNQSTVFTSHNPVINPGSKHLDIRYFRVRQHINARLLDVVHCRTNENVADFFTKSLAFPQFDHFRNILMNCSPQLRAEWASEGKAVRDKMASTTPTSSTDAATDFDDVDGS